MADHRPLDRIRHLPPSDPDYALEALRYAWRRGALDDAAMWLDRLAPDDRAAWLADVRGRLDLGAWLGGLDRATALRWLHRFVPWHEVRVIAGDASRHRGAGVPLTEAVQWVRAESELHITEPCGLPWQLEWSARAAQLLACDCAERAIGHAERVLPEWESRHPDDRRPREALEAARACVVAVRRGGRPDGGSEARAAAYAAADATSAAVNAATSAAAAYAAARAAYASAYAASASAYAYDASASAYDAAARAAAGVAEWLAEWANELGCIYVPLRLAARLPVNRLAWADYVPWGCWDGWSSRPASAVCRTPLFGRADVEVCVVADHQTLGRDARNALRRAVVLWPSTDVPGGAARKRGPEAR